MDPGRARSLPWDGIQFPEHRPRAGNLAQTRRKIDNFAGKLLPRATARQGGRGYSSIRSARDTAAVAIETGTRSRRNGLPATRQSASQIIPKKIAASTSVK
jgi:hypothetical protein